MLYGSCGLLSFVSVAVGLLQSKLNPIKHQRENNASGCDQSNIPTAPNKRGQTSHTASTLFSSTVSALWQQDIALYAPQTGDVCEYARIVFSCQMRIVLLRM
jgi:hypothetical protein